MIQNVTIETSIIEWALQRPAWQQKVLVALANGERPNELDAESLVDQISEPSSGQPSRDAKELSIRSSEPLQVQLLRVKNVRGVNALLDGQELTFGQSGLTVIYGDNGSGKSGFARLIKSIVKARHT